MNKMLEEEKLEKKPDEIGTKGSIVTKILIALVALLWVVCIVLLVQNVKLMNEVKDISGKMDTLAAKDGKLETQLKTVSDNDMLLWQAIDSIREQIAEEPEEDANQVAEYKHKVYLTFDDGPSSNTNEILDILNRYGVKATFFVIGKEGYNSQESLKRIVNEGHTLGMHSYSHQYKEIYESLDAFSEDFQKLRQYLYEVTGQESIYYRFPGGSSNTISPVDMKVYGEYLRSQGVVYIDWNADSGDASGKELSVEEMLKNSMEDVTNRETTILLMHDASNKPNTVELLPVLIEALQNLDSTAILPITEDTKMIQHVKLDPLVEETVEATEGNPEDQAIEGNESGENAESGETIESGASEEPVENTTEESDKTSEEADQTSGENLSPEEGGGVSDSSQSN